MNDGGVSESPGFRFVIAFALFLTGVSACFACAAGPFHNPDAAIYYTVALRVLHGRGLSSVDGIIGPLLSWCMVPFMKAGFSPPTAFRFVQVICHGGVFLSTAFICAKLKISSIQTQLVLFFTAVTSFYLALFVVTSDLLVACIYLVTVLLLLNWYSTARISYAFLAGCGGGLLFLAKPVGLPIFAASLAVFAAFFMLRHPNMKQLAAVHMTAAFLCSLLIISPWLLALKTKYGIFNVGLNPYFQIGVLDDREYWIDQDVKSILSGASVSPEGSGGTPIIASLVGRILHGLPLQVKTSAFLLWLELHFHFGSEAAIVSFFALTALGAWRRRIDPPIFRLLLALIAVFFCSYFFIWGARFRYYLPLVPFFVLFSTQAFVLRPRASATWISNGLSFFLFSVFVWNILLRQGFLYQYSAKLLNRSVVDTIAGYPELRVSSGALTGSARDPYSGYVAALLGREEPNYIYGDERVEVLKKRLESWQIQNIVWVGEPLEVLQQLSEFRLVRSEKIEDMTVSVFTRTGTSE